MRIPVTLKRPLARLTSLRWYWSITSRRRASDRAYSTPLTSRRSWPSYCSGDPRPYMQETEATMITSSRTISPEVAEWRNPSISSLIVESFSM